MVVKKKNSVHKKSKAHCNFKNKNCFLGKTIINLFIVVVILALVLLLISILNVNTDDYFVKKDYKIITNESSEVEISNFIDKLLNNDSEFITEYSSILINTPNILYISKENKEELENRYFFAFSKDVLDQYLFSAPEIGDYIVEYESAIIVYNYESNLIKSYFIVQAIN